MQKTNWENGTIVKEASVVIDGVEYEVTPRQIEGNTPLSADNLNNMEDNIEEAIEHAGDIYADYVVNQGTETADGITWTYIEWKSGKVELMAYKSFTGLSMTSQSAGTYYGAGTSGTRTMTLPFSLTSVLYIGQQETSPRSSGVYVYDTSISGATLTTQFRAFASSSNVSCSVNFHIIGIK